MVLIKLPTKKEQIENYSNNPCQKSIEKQFRPSNEVGIILLHYQWWCALLKGFCYKTTLFIQVRLWKTLKWLILCYHTEYYCHISCLGNITNTFIEMEAKKKNKKIHKPPHSDWSWCRTHTSLLVRWRWRSESEKVAPIPHDCFN